MTWDIYGNPLQRGHCEVHPNVHEDYPCSVCMSERGQTQQPHDALQQLQYEFAQQGDYIKQLEVERDALAAQVEALNSKNFELTCYRVDVLRCLKTIAFEHNHSDVPLYKPMASQLMDSISSNAELKEVRAEAGRAGFIAGIDALEVAQILGSDFDVETSADEYAAKARRGGVE